MINSLKNNNITNLIPQKHPFVMIDELVDFASRELTAGLCIKSDNIFVKDSTFTEPGLIEHMAQSVALHTGCEFFLKNKPAPTGYIGSIKTVNIFKLPKVSDKLQTQIKVLQEFMGITLVDISVKLNNQEIANSQMKTVIAK